MAIKIKNKNRPTLTLVEKKPAFDQSNLIALNAMFEAARNGQAGLNLAVASEKMKDFLSDSKPK
jgi:hypothetical protein